MWADSITVLFEVWFNFVQKINVKNGLFQKPITFELLNES